MNFNFASEELRSEAGDKLFFASWPSQTVKGLLESVLFAELISCPRANSFRPRPLIRQVFYSKNSKKNLKDCILLITVE